MIITIIKATMVRQKSWCVRNLCNICITISLITSNISMLNSCFRDILSSYNNRTSVCMTYNLEFFWNVLNWAMLTPFTILKLFVEVFKFSETQCNIIKPLTSKQLHMCRQPIYHNFEVVFIFHSFEL